MVAVIILNYNNYKDTINCINSVEHYNTYPIKYIIIDNASSNESFEQLSNYVECTFPHRNLIIEDLNSIRNSTSLLPYMTLYKNEKNEGYAKGNNIGLSIAYSDDEISDILILNNDILFVQDIIGELVSSLYSMKGCAIVSPLLYKKEKKGIDYNCARKNHSVWSIILTYLFLYYNVFGYLSKEKNKRMILLHHEIADIPIEIELPSGSCFLINKQLMKGIKGFDPNTFLYYEENILYKKIHSLSLKNYLIPSLYCIHLGAATTNKSHSFFILKTSLESAEYYLNNYCSLSFIQKSIFLIAKMLFNIKIFFVKKLENVF